MRTNRCAIIVISIIVLFIFSLILTDWLFLIFLIPLIIFLFAGVVSHFHDEIDVEVTRSLSNVKIFENDKIQVDLKIKNNGESISYLEIFDSLPKKIMINKGTNYLVTSLAKNEELTISYEINCPIRGHYPLGPLFLRANDFFGLFYKEALVKTDTFVSVIPQVEEIKDIEVRAKANIYPGLMQAKHAGIGTEFFGIRDYTSSDSFKKINWKSFARFNNPMVNEYELESTTDVILIVDCRDIQGIGSIKHNALEYSIKAAVSVTSHFLKRRDRVGLIAYGRPDGHLRWVYPESGKKQLYKIIEELISVQAYGDFPLNGVIFRAVTHMLPKKALVIFISSLEGDWSIEKAIEDLVARLFNVIVISPSSLDIEHSLHSSDENMKLAHRILSIERENFLTRLRNVGARVVDWNPTMPLAVSLKEVEKYQARR